VDEMIDTTLSRRHLLAGASATAAAGLLGTALPAAAKAPLLKTQAPAFYRFNVGSIEATVVSDGLIVGVPNTTFVGPAATNVEKMMTDLFLPPDKLVMDQNALVINTGDKLALFETGMASVKRTEDMGLLVGNLAGTPSEGSMRAARKNLLPSRDRILFYSDGKEAIPGVQAMHTPGHTVGHTCFVITSGSDTLYFAGDLAHHNIIIESPRMEDVFDSDRQLGIQTRLRTMDMLAAQRMRTLVYHLPWPGLGHFVKRGEGFRFEPEPIKFV
jgi:hypothetical protein